MMSVYIEELIGRGWANLDPTECRDLNEWLTNEATEGDFETYVEMAPKPEVKSRRRARAERELPILEPDETDLSDTEDIIPVEVEGDAGYDDFNVGDDD